MKQQLELITVDGFTVAVDKEPIKNGNWYIIGNTADGYINRAIRICDCNERELERLNELSQVMRDKIQKGVNGLTPMPHIMCCNVIAHSGHPSLADSDLPLLPTKYKLFHTKTGTTTDEKEAGHGCLFTWEQLPPVEQDVEQLPEPKEQWEMLKANPELIYLPAEEFNAALRGYKAAQPKQFTIEDMLTFAKWWSNKVEEHGEWDVNKGDFTDDTIVGYSTCYNPSKILTDKEVLSEYLQSLKPIPKFFEAEMEMSSEYEKGKEGHPEYWLRDTADFKTTAIDGKTYLIGTYKTQ